MPALEAPDAALFPVQELFVRVSALTPAGFSYRILDKKKEIL